MDNYQKNLYIGILAILFLLGFFALLINYSQQPEISYRIKEEISVDEISFDYRTVREINYITTIQGNIGEIKIKNPGYFKRTVYLDDLLICFDYAEEVSYENIFEGIRVNFDSGGYLVDNELKMSIEANQRIIPQIKSEDFWRYPVKGLKVYEIPIKPKNPFQSVFYQPRLTCKNIEQKYRKIAYIELK